MAGARREQILREAADLFARRGFHGASMHDVGAACGISGPALYRHFPGGKDALLSDMLVSISARLLDEGRARVEASDHHPDRALKSLIRWHIDFALRHSALIVVQDRDWDALPPEARAEVRRLQTAYVALWTDALVRSRPGLDPRVAEAAVHAVFGLLNSTPHSARLPEQAMRSLLETMAEQCLRSAAG